MARAAGALIRREDWIILALMFVGAGMALNQAAQDGDRTAFRGSIADLLTPAGWRHFFTECGAHPVACFRDTMQRKGARAYFELGLLAVALTVALRRFFPRFSGIPYGVLIAATAFLLWTGSLDTVLRMLDPRRLLESLGNLGGGIGGAGNSVVINIGQNGQPVVVPVPPATPAPGQPRSICLDANAVCGGGRGGLARIIPDRLGRCTGGSTVECRDGSTWFRHVAEGSGPVPIAGPRPACLSEAGLAREHGAVKARFAVPGGCGYVLFNSGRVINMETGAVIATEAGWRDIARRYGFPVYSELERMTR